MTNTRQNDGARRTASSPTRQRRRVTADAIWLNGRILRGQNARIRVTDRGLLYGDGLFETVRTYGGYPFLLAAHLARLRRSGRALGIPIPGSIAYWRRVIARVLVANRLTDAAVRLTVTRGTASGLGPPKRPRPTLLLHVRPLDRGLGAAQAQGIAACLLSFDRGAAAFTAHKTLAYLPAVLGRREAQRLGVQDGLYVTANGLVTEATTANLFVWHGNRLRTPRTGALPGIARRVVMELARAQGWTVEERPVPRELLTNAGELFLTSSVVEVLPLVRIQNRPVGDGRPGPVTRTLQQAYRLRVARALRRKV